MMTLERRDAWTTDDDAKLATIVLGHIREGNSQLAAFHEAAEQMGRTAAACAFRWNSVVRKRMDTEIRKAKQIRLNQKKPALTLMVITEQRQAEYSNDYVEQIHKSTEHVSKQLSNMGRQIRSLQDQLSVKTKENQELTRQLEEMMSHPSEFSMNVDYKTLHQILQRARQLGAIDEGHEKHVFKMDEAGNIEMIG